ncbi:MAG: YraN family protein [Thermoanaerobaculia bacterium]
MRDDRFREQPHARAQGRVGEDDAVDWLRRQSYRIVDRNVDNYAGELDVIARDGEILCFVEIKARSNRAYGPAIAAIPKQKQRKIARAAALYLVDHPTELACRFDVLAMDLGDGGWRYTLVKDAFPAPMASYGGY